MKQKKSCVAMLLAGGQGSRLYVLTNSLAKPGVTFGGKYKIIDLTDIRIHIDQSIKEEAIEVYRRKESQERKEESSKEAKVKKL